MKVIPFPGGDSASPDEAWLAELEAALDGAGEGAAADSWRELRGDVRMLAQPIDPEFERRLRARIAERVARSEVGQRGRRFGWLRPAGRMRAAAGVAAIAAVVAAVVIAGPWRTGGPGEAVPASQGRASTSSAGGKASAGAGVSPPSVAGGVRATKSAVGAGAAVAPGGAAPTAQSAGGVASTSGRVQQLAASITLATTPGDVQATADGVSRLAQSAGGFVQSSHVQVQQTGTSEASLELSIPSTKLSAALASLGQLAPVRAESRSLQDITDAYDAARQRLGDATAERQALLRALARATTAGQIDSLRERLSQARASIAQAKSTLQAVTQRASTAEVEVTVLGDAHAGSEGLTVHRGLHDAGRVLVVALAVLLIATAMLVPLAVVVFALVAAGGAWRRYQRERALDAR